MRNVGNNDRHNRLLGVDLYDIIITKGGWGWAGGRGRMEQRDEKEIAQLYARVLLHSVCELLLFLFHVYSLTTVPQLFGLSCCRPHSRERSAPPRAESSRAEPSQAEPSRAEPKRALCGHSSQFCCKFSNHVPKVGSKRVPVRCWRAESWA